MLSRGRMTGDVPVAVIRGETVDFKSQKAYVHCAVTVLQTDLVIQHRGEICEKG